MKALLLAAALANHDPAVGWPPPARYDHYYPGQLIVQMVDPSTFVRYCGRNAEACSFPRGAQCLVILPQGSPYVANLLRHERGHCNGWGRDHED